MPGYFSELAVAGPASARFIEIAAPAGTDMSAYTVYIYALDGTVASGPWSLGGVVTTVAGQDVYVIDNSTPGFGFFGGNAGVALVDDTGTVLQFLSFKGQVVNATAGPANGTSSTALGDATNGQSNQSDDGGSSYYIQSTTNKGTVPCYAPDTMIDTPDGPRAVEDLQVGDLVNTLAHGPQPVRWVRSGDHPLEDVEVDGKPVLIAAGALGKDLPAQDLIVSPQHRILVGGGGQLTRYFDKKAFAPAKALTRLPGIRHMKGKAKITWIHFACDRHEVITANGCLSESLLLGPMVLGGLTPAERRTLTGIFGAAAQPEDALNGPAAHTCLKVGEVRRQLADRAPPNGPDVANETRKWDLDTAMERYEAERLGIGRALPSERTMPAA